MPVCTPASDLFPLDSVLLFPAYYSQDDEQQKDYPKDRLMFTLVEFQVGNSTSKKFGANYGKLSACSGLSTVFGMGELGRKSLKLGTGTGNTHRNR